MTENQETANSLVLEYIEVENFKSYANKHRIGPFDETFTAVIGPNGSGKSNILDALLFVFGKRANKIRLDRLAELIHSSAAYPSFHSAAVSVIFREVCSGKQIHLSRVVYRHNSSTQYFINDQKHTHASVVTFLKEKGIDLEHNRFLILQGEVEQIALMRPKGEREGEEGFLEYLDDLIGTNRHASRISDLLSETEKLQDDRIVALERTHKLSKDRDLLESGKNAAMSYVKKDNQMQKIVSTMCQMKIQNSEDEIAPQREALRHAKKDKDRIDACIQKLQEKVKSHEDDVAAIVNTLQEAEGDAQKLTSDRDNYERQVQEIKSHIESVEKEERKTTDSHKRLKDDILKIKDQLEDVDRDKQIALDNQREVETRQKKNEPELSRHTESLQDQIKPIQNERAEVLRVLAPFQAQIDDHTRQIDTLTQKKAMLHRHAQQADEELQRLLRESNALREKHVDLQHEISQVEHELASHEQGGGETIRTLEEKRESVNYKRKSLGQQIESIRKQLQHTLGDDRVTKFLMSQKLHGYYGPLRNLCTIDDSYDIAAGVGGGAFWSYHVVENESVAQNCIASLKQNDIGRGSFLVLSFQQKMFGDRLSQPFHAPRGTFRLFDKIQVNDKKLTSAVYFAVRDTLVAESLQIARQVGLDKSARFRVVTVNGDLVEPSGQMTGGGQRRPQGARLQGSASVKQSPRDDLNALTASLEKLVSEDRSISEKILSMQGQNARKQEERRNLQIRLQQAKANLQREEHVISRTDITIIKQRKSVEEAESSLQMKGYKELEENIENLQNKREGLRNDSEANAHKLSTLDEALAAVGGAEYKEIQEIVANDRKWLAEQETKSHELKRAEARLKSTLQAKMKELSEEEKSRSENTSTEDKLVELRRKLVERHTLVESVSGQIQKKRAAVVAAQDAKWKLSEKVTAKGEEIREQSGKQLECVSRIDSINSEIEEKRSGVRKYEEGISTCETKIYENLAEFGNEVIAFKDVGETLHGEDFIKANTNDELRRFNTRVPAAILKSQDFKQLKCLAEQLKMEIDRVREQIDLASVKRWKEKDNLWRAEKQTYDAIHVKTVDAEVKLSDAREQRQMEFRAAFENIRLRLKSLYQILTQGGDADLEYVDEHDPFQGINFCVRPPRKSWKQIGQLSGGEKTLASLSFIFALHHYRPTPIYIMDEIDAALDFRNVSIVAQYVSTQAIQAQFIIISLRNSMFEMANQLIGVSKVKDCTTSISLIPLMMKTRVEECCSRAGATARTVDVTEEDL